MANINPQALSVLVLAVLGSAATALSVFCTVQYANYRGGYIPTGRRSMYPHAGRGQALVEDLRGGHHARILNLTRLSKDAFEELLAWLLLNTDLRDSPPWQQLMQGGLTASEKLYIFLYICGTGASFRNTAEWTQHSTRTISRAFYEVLNALLRLHKSIVQLPPEETPDEIEQDDKRWPYFCDCLGALDGSYIPIFVNGKAKERPWRNRKGWLSQNILAVVDFKMNFLYIRAGWEGSAHDATVLADALDHGSFRVPPGRYYLADAGYGSKSHVVLVPYQKTRYHLKEWAKSMLKPQTPRELFNLRHASLRNVVERVFGVLKSRFVILQRPPKQYPVRTQVKLVYALTAIHNFLNKLGHIHAEEEAKELGGDDFEDEGGHQDEPEPYIADTRTLDTRRDGIAKLMWDDYQKLGQHK
jgi:Transposase DDE domain.